MLFRRDQETKDALQEIKDIEKKYTNLMMGRSPVEATMYLLFSSLGWMEDIELLFSSKARILKKRQDFKELYNKLERTSQ